MSIYETWHVYNIDYLCMAEIKISASKGRMKSSSSSAYLEDHKEDFNNVYCILFHHNNAGQGLVTNF